MKLLTLRRTVFLGRHQSDPEARGIFAFNSGKAIAAGLAFRPVADTVRDTLAWDATRPADIQWRAGLKPEREAELLQAWRRAAGAGP